LALSPQPDSGCALAPVALPPEVLAWARPPVAVEAADWAQLGAVPELARVRSLPVCSSDDSQSHSVPAEPKAPPAVAH
jgi:hypothetical protein